MEVFERVLRDPEGRVEYHYVILDYLCRARPQAPRAGDDAGEARWAQLADPASWELPPESVQVVEKALSLRDRGVVFTVQGI